jgi:hypothetical protein
MDYEIYLKWSIFIFVFNTGFPSLGVWMNNKLLFSKALLANKWVKASVTFCGSWEKIATKKRGGREAEEEEEEGEGEEEEGEE